MKDLRAYTRSRLVSKQLLLGTFLLIAFFDLSFSSTTAGSGGYYDGTLCYPFWPSCPPTQLLKGFPDSYAYTVWTTMILVLLGRTLWQILSLKLNRAIRSLNWIYAFLGFSHFIWQDTGRQNFILYSSFTYLIFLLSRGKISVLRWTWSLLYLLAASVKIHDAWILGTYFTTLKNGLPFIPKSALPVASQLVLIFELIAPLGLLSPQRKIFTASYYSWIFFHLYSAIVIGWGFPLRCLLLLVVLFSPKLHSQTTKHLSPTIRSQWRKIALYILFSAAIMWQLVPLLSNDDERVRLDSVWPRLSMFDSNHQCEVKILIKKDDQLLFHYRQPFTDPKTHCKPWHFLRKIDSLCRTYPEAEAHLIIDHSINGSPFYRIVDSGQACSLEYSLLRRNPWILSPKEAAIVGYPTHNTFFPAQSRNMKIQFETPQIILTPYQIWLQRHYETLRLIVLTLWMLSLFVHFSFLRRCI